MKHRRFLSGTLFRGTGPVKRLSFRALLFRALTGAVCLLLIAASAFAEPAPAPAPVAANPFMQAAIEEAEEGIAQGHGGPFGAVVVKDGIIVGRGHNRVLADRDPTCHGEIAAIRDACANLGTYDLTGCELYTTGEPCPMCLFACMWANIGRVYYGCTIADNAMIGFRDEAFDGLLAGRETLAAYLVCVDRDACLALFDRYAEAEHTIY